MKTSVKKLSDTKIEVSFELGKKELEDARLVALKRMASKVKVPGFRNGKAPANVVEKHADPNQLADDTLQNAVSKAVAKGFVDEKIQVLDRPEVNVTKYVPGEMLEFTATAEVMPTIKLGNYKKLKAKKAKVTVADSEVAEVLEKIRGEYAEKKPVERAAKMTDEAVIDFVGKKDGVAFDGGSGKEFALKLGSKSFIPGFEEGVVGHKAGDKFELKLKFPKDYFSKDLKGQEVVFEVEMKAVNELVLPKLDEKLAEKCGGFKTVEEFKTDIKKNLESQKNHEASERFKDELVQELVAVSEVQTPEILIEDQIRAIRQDMLQNLAYRGLTIEGYLKEIGKTEDEWVESDVRTVAQSRVQAGLVLAELAKELDVKVDEKEVDVKLEELRYAYKNNAEAMEQLASDEVRGDVRNRLGTEKVLEGLMGFSKR